MTDPPVLDSAEAIEEHLFTSIEPWERSRHGVRFVLCDAGDRVRVHCPVDNLPAIADPVECVHAVSVFAEALADDEPAGAMLVVLTRPGSAAVADTDRVWFHAAHEACAKTTVRLLGVHLVTPSDQRPILLDDAL